MDGSGEPSVDYFLEGGADWGVLPAYGAVVAATKRLAPNLQIELGLGASIDSRT